MLRHNTKPILSKAEFLRQILATPVNVKFYENLSSEQMDRQTGRQAGMTKLIVAICYLVSATKIKIKNCL